ncbi:MAG: DUF4215 domain-containing protein, partial [Candidatus Peregrinibacteria bacterium]
GSPSICQVKCGDGVIMRSETCDDGNDVSGDGCSASCSFEEGYVCTNEPSTCQPLCGREKYSEEECSDEVNQTALLRGELVVPPVSSDRTVQILFRLNADRSLSYGSIRGTASGDALSIQSGDEGTNGPKLLDLSVTGGKTPELSSADRDLLRAGRLYVLLRSSAFPDGELRSQLQIPRPAPGTEPEPLVITSPLSSSQSSLPAEASAQVGLSSISSLSSFSSPSSSSSPFPFSICGNGIVETDEACDDGNRSMTDACLNDCRKASCGDGFLWDMEEECEPPNAMTDNQGMRSQPRLCGSLCLWAGKVVRSSSSSSRRGPQQITLPPIVREQSPISSAPSAKPTAVKASSSSVSGPASAPTQAATPSVVGRPSALSSTSPIPAAPSQVVSERSSSSSSPSFSSSSSPSSLPGQVATIPSLSIIQPQEDVQRVSPGPFLVSMISPSVLRLSFAHSLAGFAVTDREGYTVRDPNSIPVTAVTVLSDQKVELALARPINPPYVFTVLVQLKDTRGKIVSMSSRFEPSLLASILPHVLESNGVRHASELIPVLVLSIMAVGIVVVRRRNRLHS